MSDELRTELRLGLRRLAVPIAALGSATALFLLLPLLVIVPMAFNGGHFMTFPPSGFSTQWFSTLFGEEAWTDALRLSVELSLLATALATVGGTAAALALRRLGRAAGPLRTAFLIPLIVPQIVLALGLFNLFDMLGVADRVWIVAVGQAALAFPLVVVAVSAGLAGVDPALSRAAASLGHGWASIVGRVELPLVRPAVLGAAILAFGFCFDEAVVAYFLTPPGQQTLPTQIWLSARDSVSPAIAAASVLVIAVAVLAMAAASGAMRRTSSSDRKETPS